MTKKADPPPPVGAEIDARCTREACLTDQDGIYELIGGCYNCGTAGIKGIFTKGHTASDRDYECPHCGCKSVYWSRTP